MQQLSFADFNRALVTVDLLSSRSVLTFPTARAFRFISVVAKIRALSLGAALICRHVLQLNADKIHTESTPHMNCL